mgnify:CR=1 FL=1
MDDRKRKEAAASLLKDMQATSARMRELIVAMPPHDLLGYIYAQRVMKAMTDQSATEEQCQTDAPDDLIGENQFLLEYVHAVLASDAAPADMTFDEAQCAELFELGRKLREQAMFFAMATSADTKDGIFGPDTADIEFRAKSTWVMMRGNRYQVLEGEFYRYVLHYADGKDVTLVTDAIVKDLAPVLLARESLKRQKIDQSLPHLRTVPQKEEQHHRSQ